MFKRFLPLLLAMALLTGCSSQAVIQLPAQEAGMTVAYIPLDDRPVNDDRVVYLAESLGLEFLMPDQSLYHTALDYQEVNSDGSQYGDRGALWTWLMETEEDGCDVYLLSLDQLFSGGLVNSRSVYAGTDIPFPDGSVLTEEQVIDQYLLPLLSNPDNQVYLIDTVMRLAPTVGYEGFGLEEYTLLRDYAMEPRPTLEGADLTVENIIADYSLDANGNVIIPDQAISADMIENYFAARARKLTLADTLLSATQPMDNVHWLIGIDDSAPSSSIQTNELNYLRQQIAGRGAVLSGADEDGMLALCRLYSDLCYTGALPTVLVRYYGGSESTAASDFDHQSMTDVVDEHLAYLGITQVSDGSHDMELLVLTAPGDGASATWEDLITQINTNENSAMPTMVSDGAKYAYGDAFANALIGKTDLGSLFGYGGYYDLANVTGVTISNGIARWLHLAENDTVSMTENQAFAKTLADSLIKDLCYKNDSKVDLTLYVREELGGDPDNFARLDTDIALTQTFLESAMAEDTASVLKNLSKSNLMVDLEGNQMGWGTITLSEFESPWLRVFEPRYTITVEEFGTTHWW
ncbi:DUF4127 family protein [Bengtsoniella intestinalis]|uniref:DUF4127 family protein n=1 Tax=Bengtsoniella intestinalis TaxID=3073143 RepID=UPI00391F13D4